ncbi:MAG: Fic family protein [Bacteroidia bacterium]|jgi:Fic family protein/plasmid maintenance system antidote protein VapI
MNIYLKTTRERKGLMVREIAQKLGIDQALISKFESGKRMPTRKQVLALAEALDISAQELLTKWIKEKLKKEIGTDRYLVPDIWAMLSGEVESLRVQEPKVSYSSFGDRLQRLDQLRNTLQQLRTSDHYRIAEALELEYTFESNRIEGNTLTLQETDLIVNQGLTISGKSMREHLEAINHQEAIIYIKELAGKSTSIKERDVLALHNLVLRGIDSENAGRYRRVQVMITGSRHVPPAPYLIAVQMEAFFDWLKKAEHELHPVILAAEAHERLVTIHPFIDGNGRTSRLLMNLILLRNGFVIANIKGDLASRKAYYHALETAQAEQSKSTFINLVLDQEIEALERYIKIIGG